MVSLNFDATNIEPAKEFAPVPAGIYKAIITESEVKDTQNRDGSYLLFKFQITEGRYKGHIIFSNITLQNKSDKAVEIGEAQLSAITRAVGKMKISDTTQLHNIQLAVKLDVEKRPGYNERNVIKSYMPISKISELQEQNPGTESNVLRSPSGFALQDPPVEDMPDDEVPF